MKSIDEFATKYAQDKYLSVQTSQAVKAGANYVLEQIEEFLNLYGVYCINSSAKDYLKDMIEQLKK